MKYRILFFAIAFVSVLLCGNFALLGDGFCKEGYSEKQVIMTVNNCPYQVWICYRCSPLGLTPGGVYVNRIRKLLTRPPCNQTWNMNQVHQEIDLYVCNPELYFDSLCFNNYGIPPCPDSSHVIEYNHWSCWKVRMVEYLGDEYLDYEPCGDAYCKENVVYCWDPINGYTGTTVLGPIQIGTISCTLESHEITLPTKVGDVSECYIYHTPCD